MKKLTITGEVLDQLRDNSGIRKHYGVLCRDEVDEAIASIWSGGGIPDLFVCNARRADEFFSLVTYAGTPYGGSVYADIVSEVEVEGAILTRVKFLVPHVFWVTIVPHRSLDDTEFFLIDSTKYPNSKTQVYYMPYKCTGIGLGLLNDIDKEDEEKD